MPEQPSLLLPVVEEFRRLADGKKTETVEALAALGANPSTLWGWLNSPSNEIRQSKTYDIVAQWVRDQTGSGTAVERAITRGKALADQLVAKLATDIIAAAKADAAKSGPGRRVQAGVFAKTAREAPKRPVRQKGPKDPPSEGAK